MSQIKTEGQIDVTPVQEKREERPGNNLQILLPGRYSPLDQSLGLWLQCARILFLIVD